MTDVYDDGALDALEGEIDAWLASIAATSLPVEAIDRGEGDERRWYVRLRGEDKDYTTVWLTLGQRTLRYETYVMPAPEENAAELYEHLLRRNERLVGAHFSIGIEDAVFLRGEVGVGGPQRGRARPRHRHAVRHGRADVPGPAADRLRQPLRLTPHGVRAGGNGLPTSPRRTDPDTLPGGPDAAEGETREFASGLSYRDPMIELVIVGGGNMGAALVGGLLAADGADPSTLAVTEALAERRRQLAEQFPHVTVTDAVPPCAAAVIAVKPNDVPAAVAAAVAAGATRLLSIAAGVSIASIEEPPGRPSPSCGRCRTPRRSSAQGASAIAGGSSAGEEDLAWAEGILGAVGIVERVAERHLDAVTALTGSGPAYLFLVAEALIDAGVAAGLPRPLASSFTTQLFVGSSALLAERGDPAALRAMVTSPAGTTAAGLQVLEAHAVRAALAEAVAAAAARSAELGG